MYVRHDGTRTYFFKIPELTQLATKAGFLIEKIEIVERKTINIKDKVNVKRLFIQAILIKH